MSSRPSRGAARLAAILDALPDGLVLVNANGTVVNANTIALEMFETPGTALVGRGLLDLLPEFDSKLIPGSMRRPDSADSRGRTKPTRMVARRTDGGEFPAEVTSASLEDGRDAYTDSHSYTGDELLMLVVRDLSGTVDTEAELARSQRQTEMILRAASEGVVGTDTDGRVVLVNPAAAQILGFRATDLGGRELHTLILHSRADGEPFPYADSPLADTLRSGRKHRVRGQVLWAKNGKQVPVDLTTAPVRDGDQLVGAVMTFTDRRAHEELVDQHDAELAEAKKKHEAELAEATERLTAELAKVKKRLTGELAETTERLTTELNEATERHTAELADRSDRYAAEIEELTERYGEVAARHAQLTAVLGEALRGPLEELRGELATLAADPAGQLWPEANQILHHLAAGYARMTTLVDNVLGYQRLDDGTEGLAKANVLLDGVVAAGVEGAVELIGPGRAQFAVHAPPIEAEVDPGRLAQALAHLIADVAGVDSTGRARLVAGAAGTSTRRSWWPPRSAVTSYGSRCAARSPGAIRCTSRSCAGSCGRTAGCSRRTRCRAWAAARTCWNCRWARAPGPSRPCPRRPRCRRCRRSCPCTGLRGRRTRWDRAGRRIRRVRRVRSGCLRGRPRCRLSRGPGPRAAAGGGHGGRPRTRSWRPRCRRCRMPGSRQGGAGRVTTHSRSASRRRRRIPPRTGGMEFMGGMRETVRRAPRTGPGAGTGR